MPSTGSRAVVSALLVGVHLLALAHGAVDEHALRGGAVVHLDRRPEAAPHAHDGASLCEDAPPADPSPCDALALTRSSLLSSPVRGVAAFQGWRAVQPRTRSTVVASRKPLSWAPKASPPAVG